MKQGRASSNVREPKTEPRSKAVSPGGISQYGLAQAQHPAPLYEGRGYKAPMNSIATHKGGSQGRYR